MPLSIVQTAGGTVHPNPFIGPIDHTAQVRVDVSGLTSREVDASGYIKPGVLLTRAGLLAIAPGQEQQTIIAGGAAGAHTLTGIATEDQIIEVTYAVGSGTDITDLTDLTSEFTISAADEIDNTGGTATTGGELIVKWRDMSVQDYIYGAVVEAVKVAANNGAALASAPDVDVAVAVIGMLNRDILEDSLGSALTANEMAALFTAGCHLALSST